MGLKEVGPKYVKLRRCLDSLVKATLIIMLSLFKFSIISISEVLRSTGQLKDAIIPDPRYLEASVDEYRVFGPDRTAVTLNEHSLNSVVITDNNSGSRIGFKSSTGSCAGLKSCTGSCEVLKSSTGSSVGLKSSTGSREGSKSSTGSSVGLISNTGSFSEQDGEVVANIIGSDTLRGVVNVFEETID